MTPVSREAVGGSPAQVNGASAREPSGPPAASSAAQKEITSNFDLVRASRRTGASSIGKNRHQPRLVGCFHCDTMVEVTYAAKAASCTACGEDINLNDYEINKELFEDLFTRGNITINRLGAIKCESLVCHNLKAYGHLTGLVHSTGDVMIRTRAELPGGLRCKKLMVGRDAHVHVDGEVHAEELEIDGHITADSFFCAGVTLIDERGSVTGPLKTKSVSMENGGCLNGTLEIISKPKS